MTLPFTNRHIVVTGAGSGIGRAIALRLSQGGATLTLLGRRLEALQSTAADCMEAGADVVWTASCDVRERSQLDEVLDEAVELSGPIHAAIANSGIGGPNSAGPDDRFDEIIATNLGGAYYTLRAAEKRLAPGPDPRHFVVVASILARIGVGGYTAYCASKAGLLGLVRAYSQELARHNVLVNAVCPGWVDTEMARAGIQGMADHMKAPYETALAMAMKDVPLRRMSTPDEIAGFVAFLLSPDARGITGQGLDLNNGAFMD